jgi:hypothetical protein
MVFVAIGMRHKSCFLMAEESIDVERYIRNLDSLGFIETLGDKHAPFGSIFQSDDVPSDTSQVALDELEESIEVIISGLSIPRSN